MNKIIKTKNFAVEITEDNEEIQVKILSKDLELELDSITSLRSDLE